MFDFIIGLVNCPSYIPGVIQEGLDMNVVNMNEHILSSLIYDAEDLFIYHHGEYDIIDAYDASREYLPPNYIISRENYIYGSCGGY